MKVEWLNADRTEARITVWSWFPWRRQAEVVQEPGEFSYITHGLSYQEVPKWVYRGSRDVLQEHLLTPLSKELLRAEARDANRARKARQKIDKAARSAREVSYWSKPRALPEARVLVKP